ncbi:MAG: hypothetical protein WBO70_07950, partial [Erysipelotrichaceae bacterium]
AQQTVDIAKQALGNQFAAYIQQYYQVTTEEQYLQVVESELKAALIAKEYISSDFDNFIKTYKPVKMAVASFDKEETALMAIKQVNEGKDLKDVATANNAKDYKGVATIYSSLSEISTSVLDFGQNIALPKINPTPISNSDKTVFYVVSVIERDGTKIKDEVIETLHKENEVVNKATTYFFKKYDLKVYDKTLYDKLKATYNDYFK